jgi:putative spermidine/putrescine transport system ATP-binding protein
MEKTMSFLEIVNLQKSFGSGYAVQGFNLSVAKGEFISFLGPSGCGKTTTLRMVAGFEMPTSGSIRIDGRDITTLPANQRKIGMVFQSYALFPNMTIEENVAFGLKVARKPAGEIAARVDEMLKLIGLPHLGKRYPYQLSGGQQQRVALARALAPKPQILLLDEPLSALDAKIRVSLRDEIRAVQRELGITTIYVTHDQEEALSMSDRIVVMHDGRVEQIGTPSEIYGHPATRFVASFIGTLNVLQATVIDPATGHVRFDGQSIMLPSALTSTAAGSSCTLAMRPEALSLVARRPDQDCLSGLVEEVHFLGPIIRTKVRVDQNVITLDSFNHAATAAPERGQPANIWFAKEDILVLPNEG